MLKLYIMESMNTYVTKKSTHEFECNHFAKRGNFHKHIKTVHEGQKTTNVKYVAKTNIK